MISYVLFSVVPVQHTDRCSTSLGALTHLAGAEIHVRFIIRLSLAVVITWARGG
ncbi:unnamed protein product [Haemonchus placei]|uniref:Secreted protein n=1 Tax=Haemonchus placei TaxID=6290 RepID=A0A0N4WSA7_HAEPC|nr:unnamed protein product [Haemonchus placei]